MAGQFQEVNDRFKFGRRRAKRGPSEARSERSDQMQSSFVDQDSFNHLIDAAKQKAKLLDDKMSKTLFFLANSIFSLLPSPQRGPQFDNSASKKPIVSPVRPNVIVAVVVVVR